MAEGLKRLTGNSGKTGKRVKRVKGLTTTKVLKAI